MRARYPSCIVILNIDNKHYIRNQWASLGGILRKGKDGLVCALNNRRLGRPSTPCQSHSLPSSTASSFRVVVVGDIHGDWDLEHDYKALKCLQPELVLFTGDFGDGNVELVRSVAKVKMPKAVILGNHDTRGTQKFSRKRDATQLQIEALGEEYVGYGRLDFPELKVSVVGGRPFSRGGGKLFRKKLLKRYGVKTMEDSADRIRKAAMGTPYGHSIIFLAHNGPTGLGSSADDICGKDWEGGGDFGDPDLAEAISLLKVTSTYSVPLVVFGHMHKEMRNGGFRKMISLGYDSTVYLNTAIVPRVKPLDSGSTLRAFTVVDFRDGIVTKVVETWVSVIGDQTFKEEHILFDARGTDVVERAIADNEVTQAYSF